MQPSAHSLAPVTGTTATISRRQFSALLAAGAVSLATPSFAQDFPAAKPIKLVVPFPAGGSSDAAGRLIAQEMGLVLGQSMVVDNKGGANGIIGTDAVAKSAADGYTLVLVDIFHTTAPIFTRKMPYDAVKDFVAVGQIAKTPAFLFANPAFVQKTLGDTLHTIKATQSGINQITATKVLDLAKANPGKVTMAIPGAGSVVVELLRAGSGAQFTNVPYRGSSPALIDMISGQVDLMITTMASAAVHHKSGKLSMLATTAPKRHPDFPDVPTLAELGVKGMEYEQWFGVLAPAGTPKAIVDKLNAALVKAVGTPNSKERIAGLAMDVAAGSSEEFRKRVELDAQRWVKLASDMGIKPLD
jgi:tripartite-type tricarboxylate transporter receptor subunit TctC